jgi:hypothetical protein
MFSIISILLRRRAFITSYSLLIILLRLYFFGLKRKYLPPIWRISYPSSTAAETTMPASIPQPIPARPANPRTSKMAESARAGSGDRFRIVKTLFFRTVVD